MARIGIGKSKAVEKIEKQMVSLAEGKELAKSGTVKSSANEQDWDSAWGFDEEMEEEPEEAPEPTPDEAAPVASAEDDGADAWGWDDGPEDVPEEEAVAEAEGPSVEKMDEDDEAADAWGWGEEDTVEEPPPPPEPKKQPAATRRKETRTRDEHETREMVLKETYHISSMPEPVLSLIFAILEDGAALTGPG